MAIDTQVPLGSIDLSAWEFWDAPEERREAAFVTLRREDPVRFFDEVALPGFPPGPGYWALVRHDDVLFANRHAELFCSGRGTNIPDFPVEIAEFFGSMINMDDPRHGRLRGLVQKGFVPKMVRQVEGYVRDKARAIVDDLLEKHPDGTCDFVEEVAAPLPLQIICDMMGIPDDDQAQIFAWTNIILGFGDPDFAGTFDTLMETSVAMFEYAQQLGHERLQHPRSDIASELMHAVVDGERLSPSDFGSFFILLAAAGNETTRNAISHGMKALTDHPDQRRIWWEDFDTIAPTAVEEIVRWATPVIHFRRTATRDTEIRGVKITEGDKVLLWFNSANRDEEQFDDPFRFDVRRSPNQHLGFGGGGPHFCLGRNLAQSEIAAMFDEIRRRLPRLEVTGEPARLKSPFIHGIKRMPCAWR